ncbi:MAG: XRE family transcriptional regulator [Rhodospirillaceae bacterium]|nr:MAG: XRE family transcriptional regulator [Rhodospirillaceae bacterium]
MAQRGQKIFAGTRIRRLRRELNLTLMQMAGALGISTSYLNLIERNQRPLSAKLLLDMANAYDIDLKEFSGDEDSQAATSLKEVFSDPLFDGLKLSNHELTDLVGASSSAAQSVVTLYRAYREALTNNTAMAEKLIDFDGASQTSLLRFPIEEVRDFFHNSNNHFPELENAAEILWTDSDLSLDDLYVGLRTHLKKAHDISVKIVPFDVFPDITWRLDRHSRRLFLSETLSPSSRTFQLSLQIGLLGFRGLLDEVVARTGLVGDEARQICRLGLANYFAGCVQMPYETFKTAAETLRYDVELLCKRFNASYEQVSHRLTTLQRMGNKGVPFFFLRIDHAGNVSKRFSASGFHFARFGGTCPRWAIHEAFRTPRKVITQVVEMEDKTTFISMSRTVTGIGNGYHMSAQQLAIGIGCKIDYASKLVYGDNLNLEHASTTVPIGVNCRLCLRNDCNQRANPPMNRRVAVEENQRGLTPFTFEEF